MGINTIVLAVQSDAEEYDRLVDATLDIAKPTGASVVIGVAHSEETYEAANEDFDGRAAPDELARRNRQVKDAVDRFDSAGISVKIQAGVGDAGETFVSIAEESNADLLFIQGRSRSPTGKALFGSVAQTVLLNAPCPVTFVRQ